MGIQDRHLVVADERIECLRGAQLPQRAREVEVLVVAPGQLVAEHVRLGESGIQPLGFGRGSLSLFEIARARLEEKVAPEIRASQARMGQGVAGIERHRAFETPDRLLKVFGAPAGSGLPLLARADDELLVRLGILR